MGEQTIINDFMSDHLGEQNQWGQSFFQCFKIVKDLNICFITVDQNKRRQQIRMLVYAIIDSNHTIMLYSCY